MQSVNKRKMKKVKIVTLILSLFFVSTVQAQYTNCGGSYTPVNPYPCTQGSCCSVWNACNGPIYPDCNNYDAYYYATGGCDMSCAPIDSGVLFLLLGGAAFGGMMIMRRRQEALEVIKE